MSNEIWKDIAGYEGQYQVSNLGNVRSLDRDIEQWSRYGHTIIRRLKGKVLAPFDNGTGYLAVGLKNNQEVANHYVHRLVASAFVEKPNGMDVINHLDYNRKNNEATNLEWSTQKENTIYSSNRMRHEHKQSKQTSTGEKYITRKKNRWRLNIQRIGIRVDKTFPTLQEAVEEREVILGGTEHHAG